MQATLKSKVSETLTKNNFSREDVGFISEVLNEIDNRQDEKFQICKDLFLTQRDKTEFIERIDNVKVELVEKIESIKTDMYKAIFTVGLIQLVAIIWSIMGTLNYMRR